MFDANSAQLLEAAPAVPGLDPGELPELLTRHYAQLVARRLRNSQEEERSDSQWPLERIADVYEIIASVSADADTRRPAAFVSGTAQQILARETELAQPSAVVALSREQLAPSIASALLFFIAEQYADAYEAGGLIDVGTGSVEIRRLAAHIRDLVRGRVQTIASRRSQADADSSQELNIEEQAFRRLASTLADGIEFLALDVLSEPPSGDVSHRRQARIRFQQVLTLSGNSDEWEGLAGVLRTSYPGPAHLASLLLAASDGLDEVCLTKLPPPKGSDEDFWKGWLRFRAEDNPYIWHNHREAIGRGFQQVGMNSVLVLPTGAGKTTVSTLKIASTLASGKKVVFLVPTHALAEQVTSDLQGLFPSDRFGMKVSAEFDSLLVEGNSLQDIEVMTPEGCLAMLSYLPESFSDVGLLVFDECHLLSPKSDRIGRALDGMLCLLAFCEQVPDADLLFLSAMLKNAEEFGDWIADLTGRDCAVVELLWKPSRQARGVVVYQDSDIAAAEKEALSTQRQLDAERDKVAASLRTDAKKALVAKPYAVWGLRHNWADVPDARALTALSDTAFPLSGRYARSRVTALPNANETAAQLAVSAARGGAKSIVFVNTKLVSVTTAKKICDGLNRSVTLNDQEQALWSTIEAELGDVKHSVFGQGGLAAVPHNAAMLRVERMLSEQLFKRAGGAMTIVATPTLAQGLNLPAQMAILAGDKRAADQGKGREGLEAHELLNAAARAGRAGHLANGIVLLVPEPLVKFGSSRFDKRQLEAKLKSVLPEDDRCVTITDPLEKILDLIACGDTDAKYVRYTINRLATLAPSDADSAQMDKLMARSFGAFMARQRQQEDAYLTKTLGLWTELQEAVEDEWEGVVLRLASKTGLPLDVLERLRQRLLDAREAWPDSVVGWIHFIFLWLGEDGRAREHLLLDVRKAALSAAGRAATDTLGASTLRALEPAVIAWVSGEPLNEIERILKGDPDSGMATLLLLPRARDLTSSFIVRGLSFIAGVVARMVVELDIEPTAEDESLSVINGLSAAIRRGFDSPEKLAFANRHAEVLGRVELHRIFAAEQSFDAEDWGDL
ncbi:DEAD/DEAH box helicase [Delftia sp. WSY_22]|uniref:DEAD/DEAH box helicase n=1 Tax=Delftia sp. WSY_22 TaxID=3367213 RepID=UPI00370C380C